MIFVCTTQMCTDTSTATHVDSSKHSFRQSDSDVYGYNVPFSDATPSSIAHISHRSKHNESCSTSNSKLHHGYSTDDSKWNKICWQISKSFKCIVSVANTGRCGEILWCQRGCFRQGAQTLTIQNELRNIRRVVDRHQVIDIVVYQTTDRPHIDCHTWPWHQTRSHTVRLWRPAIKHSVVCCSVRRACPYTTSCHSSDLSSLFRDWHQLCINSKK